MKPINTLTGTVQHGHNRGKDLGYPTVNFKIDETLAEGVYLSRTFFQNTWYNSLTFIGAAKTFDEKEFLAETYILDFEKDIYGETVTIEILKKLRGNIKFPSSEELVVQMKKDEEDARTFFAHSSSS